MDYKVIISGADTNSKKYLYPETRQDMEKIALALDFAIDNGAYIEYTCQEFNGISYETIDSYGYLD